MLVVVVEVQDVYSIGELGGVDLLHWFDSS